ncbi:MAG: adenylate/guanylate cyclase domain-containing protein [Myxococcales bacterium]|nr:adenylate/guanylate cyclase domain-containing protein [Myxococcales bacterium]
MRSPSQARDLRHAAGPDARWSTRLTWIFLIAVGLIGPTAAAVGAYYITLTVDFPEDALARFLAALVVLVTVVIGGAFFVHLALLRSLRRWLKTRDGALDPDAWREALNYPVFLAMTVGVSALLVVALAALYMGLSTGSGALAMHVVIGGLLAAIIDAIFVWLYTDAAVKPLLERMAALNPLLPVRGPGIVGPRLGTKLATVITGVTVVGSVVAGTLAYRGAEQAVTEGDLQGLALRIFAVTVLGLAVSLTGCLLVTRHVTRPLEELTAMLAELSPDRYHQRALPRDADEVAQLMSAINHMLGGLEEREFIKDAFGRYVNRQVSDVIMQGGLELGGELLEVTILMSDIRGFTPMSERLDPRAVVELLNRYFTEMVQACMEHDGLIDKFIGDAIMVVFGAPVRTPPEQSALAAARAALAMRERLVGLNERLAADGLPTLRTGIGIHAGEAIAGNIGSPERMNYTVIGDSVNVAARIETACKELGHTLLISEVVRDLLGARAIVGDEAIVHLKGKSLPARVFPLVGLQGDDDAP